jgi:osmotically-inducible protein OsmY
MRRFDLKVVTVRGVVTLSGDLPNEAAVNHAKAVVLRVGGVKRVDTTGLTVPNGAPSQPPTR